ncbi:MAG: Uma2 family endonuclease [Candidatus Competibacteraceae bacterium]|nr:Uma2 family endonuclease [Candidatus Competibacteraceae bacterium]
MKADERPLMVVEILSPKQGVNEVTEKIEVYLRAGIKSCWMVIPPVKTIVIFHDINKPVFYSSGTLTDWILNMEIPVEEIFK